MATIVINCDGSSGSFENNGNVRVTYSLGAGTITITQIEGMRTDGYRSWNQSDKTAKVTVYRNSSEASTNQKTISLGNWVDFGASSTYNPWNPASTTWNFDAGGKVYIKVTPVASSSEQAYYGKTFTQSDSEGTIIVDPKMTVDGTVTNTNTVGSVYYSATASVSGQTVSSYAWTIDGKTATQSAGTQQTMTGITPNSNISWSVTATSSGGLTATDSGTLATIHTAPTLSGGTWTNGTRTSGKYQGTLAYNRTFNNGTSFGSHTLVYGTSTSYGTTATDPGSGTTWTLSNLTPNTTYYWKVTETDNGLVPATSTLTGSFTVTGIAPTISNVSVTPGENNCAFSWTATPDTGASISSRKIEYGTSTSYGSQITPSGNSGTITNLSGATKYYYRITVTDNKGRSGTATGNFTTLSYAPRNIVIVGEEIKVDSIKVSWTADVPAGDPITSQVIHINDGSSTTDVTLSTSATNYTFSNLSADKDYHIWITITNAIGSGSNIAVKITTLLPAPTLSTTVTAPAYNQVQVVASGSISPSRTLKYKFSSDNGTTWTAEQSSGTYTFNNLTEETTYNIVTEVRAVHTGTYSGDTYLYKYNTITTPADQAKVRLKSNGSWIVGKAWIKVNGVWKKAKKVYIKKNGQWVLNKNG